MKYLVHITYSFHKNKVVASADYQEWGDKPVPKSDRDNNYILAYSMEDVMEIFDIVRQNNDEKEQ